MKSKGLLDRHDFFKKLLRLGVLLLAAAVGSINSLQRKKKKKNDSGWPSLSSIGEHLEAKFDAFFTQVVPGNFFTSKNSPRSPISTNDVVTVTADGTEKHELHTRYIVDR